MNNEKSIEMTQPSRREFLKTVSVGSAGILNMPYLASSAWRSSPPSDTIRHAVIGVGGQGGGHIRRFDEEKGCELVAVCDVDPRHLNEKIKGLSNESRIQKYMDFRKLLEDKTIDSVSIATPDHWHTPIALRALQADKHVYVEKPCSHTIQETNLLVKAAKEFNKCVQHGTQRRSEGDHIEGIKQLQKGIIGDVHTVKAIDHQFREPIGIASPENPPAGVDYDMWLGPAPKAAFTKNRWHYNWHWFWDYGGGDTVNDGVHQIDVAVWVMGDRYPNNIIVSSGQYYYKDDHETPDTQTAMFEYDDGVIIWEMRLWTPYKVEGHDNGNVVYGTEGKMDFGRAGVIVTTKEGKEIKINSPESVEPIVPNFLTAVRANDPDKLNSPIERGAIATNLCHIINIGERTGAGTLKYDPIKESIEAPGFDKEAQALLGKKYRKGYELSYNG